VDPDHDGNGLREGGGRVDVEIEAVLADARQLEELVGLLHARRTLDEALENTTTHT